MALNVHNIELNNSGLIIDNAYSRVTSFSWDIANYNKLSVVVSTWKDKDSFLANKSRLFISQHIITITETPDYATAYNSVALLIYNFLKNNVDIFANSEIVD